MKKTILALLVFLAAPCPFVPARAAENPGRDDGGFWSDWGRLIERMADEPTSYEAYFPFAVRHMRWNYHRDEIDRYNESPGGLGFGISRNENHVEHSLYLVGFNDSNRYFQASFGYGWLAKIWNPGSFFNIGGGFTISAQMRHEYDHIPIPLPLPLAGADLGPVSVQAAYVPGWHGMGNVAIFWVKLRI
ncbi:MAG: hypothetical protein LBI17_03535 [Rickettsiales bacterium]|jgi:palmitoyl transferase|nr:hypothetical protein [Rickettsiales bacterium]